MTPICAVDTETTSLRPDRRAWDIALIRRDDEGERRVQFFIELDALDLPNAVRGYRPCGPTPTSSPRSAARPWRLSRSTWRTSATSERPYLPTAEAGGFSGGIR